MNLEPFEKHIPLKNKILNNDLNDIPVEHLVNYFCDESFANEREEIYTLIQKKHNFEFMIEAKHFVVQTALYDKIKDAVESMKNCISLDLSDKEANIASTINILNGFVSIFRDDKYGNSVLTNLIPAFDIDDIEKILRNGNYISVIEERLNILREASQISHHYLHLNGLASSLVRTPTFHSALSSRASAMMFNLDNPVDDLNVPDKKIIQRLKNIFIGQDKEQTERNVIFLSLITMLDVNNQEINDFKKFFLDSSNSSKDIYFKLSELANKFSYGIRSDISANPDLKKIEQLSFNSLGYAQGTSDGLVCVPTKNKLYITSLHSTAKNELESQSYQAERVISIFFNPEHKQAFINKYNSDNNTSYTIEDIEFASIQTVNLNNKLGNDIISQQGVYFSTKMDYLDFKAMVNKESFEYYSMVSEFMQCSRNAINNTNAHLYLDELIISHKNEPFSIIGNYISHFMEQNGDFQEFIETSPKNHQIEKLNSLKGISNFISKMLSDEEYLSKSVSENKIEVVNFIKFFISNLPELRKTFSDKNTFKGILSTIEDVLIENKNSDLYFDGLIEAMKKVASDKIESEEYSKIIKQNNLFFSYPKINYDNFMLTNITSGIKSLDNLTYDELDFYSDKIINEIIEETDLERKKELCNAYSAKMSLVLAEIKRAPYYSELEFDELKTISQQLHQYLLRTTPEKKKNHLLVIQNGWFSNFVTTHPNNQKDCWSGISLNKLYQKLRKGFREDNTYYLLEGKPGSSYGSASHKNVLIHKFLSLSGIHKIVGYGLEVKDTSKNNNLKMQ